MQVPNRVQKDRREEEDAPVYLVGLHKPDKHWEKDRGGCRLGILPEVLHSIIKGILQKAEIFCVPHI